ncbi:MAG TPA: apolipoprotein N-acyltransferase [Candidatus Cloacimonadota bacterium]|nr:apolipoprotein N-acyltransferase [Candidatus Cloacimonadota bacterium]
MKFNEAVKTWYQPVLAGFLLGVSRLPIHLGFLVFFGFIPLFTFFNQPHSNRQILKAAILFAVTYTIVSLHWITLVTWGGFAGLLLIFSLYFFIVFLLIGKAWRHFPKIRLLIFICFWMSFEYLQNFGEFRFPWFNIGYSLADYLPFIQPAELGGIYLLSILIIIVNFLIWKAKADFARNSLLLCGIIILWAGFGFIRLKTIDLIETDTKIAMVQASIPQKLKWEPTYLDTTVELYEKLSRKISADHPDLLIWPESALPVYTLTNRTYRRLVQNLANELDTDIFLGMPHYRFVGKSHPNNYEFYNAATRFGKDGKVDPYYVKNVLVPFGERLPLLKLFPFLWNVHLGQANWEYGTKQEFYRVDEYTYSPLICFEIAFEPLTTKMAEHGVDFIVNITNDAWFYRSAGTYQHAVMAKFRAVETRRSIYRCANTGYSFIVLPTGEIRKQTKLFEQTALSADLVRYSHNSFFTKFFPHYPFVFVLGAGVMVIWMIIIKLRKKEKLANNVS